MLRLAILISLMALAQAEDRPPPDPVVLARLQALVPSNWFVIPPSFEPEQDGWGLYELAEGKLEKVHSTNAKNELWSAWTVATSNRRRLSDAQIDILSSWLGRQSDSIELFHQAFARAGINRPKSDNHDRFISVCRNLTNLLIISAKIHAFRHEYIEAWRDANYLLEFTNRISICGISSIDNMVSISLRSISFGLISYLAIEAADQTLITQEISHLGNDVAIDVNGIIRKLAVSPSAINEMASAPEGGPEWAKELENYSLISGRIAAQVAPTVGTLTQEIEPHPEFQLLATHERVLYRESTIRARVDWANKMTKSQPANWAEAELILDGPLAHDLEQKAGSAIGLFTRSFESLTNAALGKSDDAAATNKAKNDAKMIADLSRLFRDDANPMGVILNAAATGSMKSSVSMVFDYEAKRRLTRMALAVSLRRIQLGRWPASSDEITVPGIMVAVPLDPYDGKPLRYDPVNQVIWSVGKDMVDDGGESPMDIVLKLTTSP